MRNIAVYVVELQKKKKNVKQKTCWNRVLLLANSGAEFHIEDVTCRHNEMCLQGLNLSSTQISALHHDSALLQPAMNAVGLLPNKVKT